MFFRHYIYIYSFGGNNNVSLARLHDSQRCAVKYKRAITHTRFSRYLKLTAGDVKQPTVRDRAKEKEIKTGIDFSPSPSVHPPRAHYSAIMVLIFFLFLSNTLSLSFFNVVILVLNFSSESRYLQKGSFPIRKREKETDLT